MPKKIAVLFAVFGMTAVLILSVTPVASAFPTIAGCGLSGDVNDDGQVDVTDIMMVSNCWRSTEAECDPCDVDRDADIDIVDIMLVAAQWGASCPAPTPTHTSTATNTSTPTSTPTAMPTSTPTMPTATETPTITPTPTFTASWTPTSVATDTATPTSTSTSTPTHTPTDTPTVTNTPTHTPTATSTSTPTSSLTPISTSTPAGTSTSTPTSSLTPTPTSTPTVTATPTLAPVPGVLSVGMSLGTSDPVALSRLHDAGVPWVSTSIAWSSVESSNKDLTNPANGSWPDGWFQTVVNTYGFIPVVTVWENPSWAASISCGPIHPTSQYINDPTHLAEFAEFVGALAARYDGDDDYNNDGTPDGPVLPEVLYFGLYNEPDFDLDHPNGETDYGGCWGQAPEAYAEMLREAYLAMKAGNPRVQVLFGSIAYDRFTAVSKPAWYPGPTGPFDYDFTQDVVTYLYSTYSGHSDLPFFDVMGLHYYSDFRNAWDGTVPYDQDLLGKIKHIKDNQLYKAGVYDLANVPFVNSETSLPSAPTDTWTNRNEAYQSDYVAQAYVQGMAAGLVTNVWFTLADYTQFGRCNQTYDWLLYGVLCSAGVDQASDACDGNNPIQEYSCPVDLEPKPAYDALQVLNAEMAGVTYEGQMGPSETGSSNIMAFRFNKADGQKKIVAWTDTGERIGAKSYPPLTIDMDLNASHFGGEWTGRLRVVDKMGNEKIMDNGCTGSISMQITQGAKYIEVYP